METNFNSIDSVVENVLKLLDIPKPPDTPIATPLILASVNRTGSSATKIAAEVIRRQSEAGIPVGALPDGSVNPTEQMYIILIEEIFKALYRDIKLSVAIQPGISVTAAGTDATGTPVAVQGVTTSIGIGNAVLQSLIPIVFLLNFYI